MTRLSLTPLAVLLSLAVLSACNQGNEGTENKATQSLAMPTTLRTATLPDSSRLRASLNVNGTRQDMTISGGTASATVPNLPPGSSSVSITFEYDSPDFGNRMLATAARTLVLQPGENTLAFSDQDYQFPDDDNDSYTNLSEIQNTTNPDDRADPAKQWGLASRVSSAEINARDSRLAVGAGGNALAVWRQGLNLWASHFADAGVWTIAEQISLAQENISPIGIHVVMDALGNGSLVWSQGRSHLANRFDAVAGWGEPAVRTEISLPETQLPAAPHLAVNSRGDAVAVWVQRPSLNELASFAWADRFDVATGGSLPTRISDDNAGPVAIIEPIAKVDANGNAMALWGERALDSTGTSQSEDDTLWASRYVADTGWGNPIQIENASLAFVGPGGIDMAIDREGNAEVAWAQRGEVNQVSYWAARYNAVTNTWGNAESIGSDMGNFFPFSPTVRFNAQGKALAVWIQTSATGPGTIYANSSDPVFGWGEASAIVTDQSGLSGPTLAIGSGGEALAAWTQREGMQNFVWVSLFEPITGWGTPTLAGFENSDEVEFSDVRVGLDDKGRGLALWLRFTGGSAGEVWSNRLQ